MGCWVTRAVLMSLHFFSFSSHFICSTWIQLQASNKNNHIFSGLRLINWKSLVNPVDRLLKWSRCLLEDWVSDAGSSDLRRALLRTLPSSCPGPCLALLLACSSLLIPSSYLSSLPRWRVWAWLICQARPSRRFGGFFCVLGLQEFWEALKRGERSWLRRFFLLK